MRQDNRKQLILLCGFGVIPIVWLGLLIAPAVAAGQPNLLQNIMAVFDTPLQIKWHEDSIKTVLILIAAYVLGIGIYLSTKRNTRPREEHGSAKWGDAAVVNRRYRDKRFTQNKILTQNVRIGLNGKKHRRNLNVLVVGGSGAGKTRFYAKPSAPVRAAN